MKPKHSNIAANPVPTTPTADAAPPHWKIPDRIYNSALALAMLALQSERYGNDPDYRQAVDDVLGWATPWSRSNRPEFIGAWLDTSNDQAQRPALGGKE